MTSSLTNCHYFATCARGLEAVLAGELRELGAGAVEPGRGGVFFAGDRAMLYRANLWLRTAILKKKTCVIFARRRGRPA